VTLFQCEAATMLLSALFKLPWIRSARHVTETSDRRGDERYEAYHPVTIRMPGMPSVAGTLISISLGGAAIRFHGWVAEVPEAWLTRLKRGDELRLDGLIGVPMSCRTVTADSGVLRVQFGWDDNLRHKLRSMVNDFTGTLPTARMSDRTLPGQRTPRSTADLSAVELRAQAAEYRELATTVRTEAAANTLVRLATAYEALAKRKEEGPDLD
jgi:hypothetical protein